MIKVNKKMLKEFLDLMDDLGEFVGFYSTKQLKQQMEMVFNSQGYWSANYIRVYWDKDTKDFRIEERF